MMKKIVLSAVAVLMLAACGQSPEEKVKAFDEAIKAMEEDYFAMRDSQIGRASCRE